MGKATQDLKNAYYESLGMLPSDQSLMGEYGLLGSAGQGQLRNYYGQIQQDIGQQFSPAFRMAQARLAGSPLLADSGYANRLNRELQQGAYSDLMGRYGNAANELAGGNLAALRNMIAQRQSQRAGLLGEYAAQKFGYATRPRRTPWGTIGAIGGALIGTAINPGAGTLKGASIGSSVGQASAGAPAMYGPWQ